MKISDLLSMCFRSLFRRKVRTFLTVIGVVIGTSSIVLMVSLGIGLNQSYEEQISQWSDITMIEVMSNNYGNPNGAENKDVPQLNDDAVEYFRSMGYVEGVSPVLNLYSEAKILTGKYQFTNGIVGMDLTQIEKMGYKVTNGRFPTGADDGYTVLFGENAGYSFYNYRTGKWPGMYSPDGEKLPPTVDTQRSKFTIQVNTDGQGGDYKAYGGTVIVGGSAGSPGSGGPEAEGSASSAKVKNLKVSGILKADQAKDYNTDGGVFIDIKLARKLLAEYNKKNGIKDNFTGYQNVKVKVENYANVAEVEQKIKDLGFSTYSAQQQLDAVKEQSRLIQLVLGCLGGISLLVAALGITNTMIMSIYERTREIGIMKVLGCELYNIRAMFLCEAGAIGFMGGVVGLVFSYLISMAVNYFVGGYMMNMGGGPTSISVIPIWLALLGMGFSIAVGLIAGFLPANRAVRISALSAIKQD